LVCRHKAGRAGPSRCADGTHATLRPIAFADKPLVAARFERRAQSRGTGGSS
jgi:hypothetical protein